MALSEVAVRALGPLVALFGHPTCTEECPLSGGKADMTRAVTPFPLMTLSRHWYAQSPIHVTTRLEANRASLFNHFEWWRPIRSRRRCNSLVYRRPISWQDARTQSLSLVTPSGGEST